MTICLCTYDGWKTHMKSVTRELTLSWSRDGKLTNKPFIDERDITINGHVFDSALILDVYNRLVNPRRVELWVVKPLESIVQQMYDDGYLLDPTDFASCVLVMIGENNECGVVANIDPDSERMKRIKMEKL